MWELEHPSKCYPQSFCVQEATLWKHKSAVEFNHLLHVINKNEGDFYRIKNKHGNKHSYVAERMDKYGLF